jgi:hypothetical protein
MLCRRITQPAQTLQEDFPAIASYLRSLTGEPEAAPESEVTRDDPSGTEDHVEATASLLTDELMGRVSEIVERSTREGRDADSELREAVAYTVAGARRRGDARLDDQIQQTGSAGDDAPRQGTNESPGR